MSDDYDVAASLKGSAVMTGTIGVSLRIPIARIDVKTVVLAGGSWGPARVSDVNPGADDLGKAYRVSLTTARGPQAMVYVKIGEDDWICASTAQGIDEAAELTTRLHEDAKYPRYQRMRDKEIREWIELNLKSAGELATSTIAIMK